MKNQLLVLIVWTASVLAAYHFLVVEQYYQPKREVWVVDLEAQEARIKDQAIKAVAAGEILSDKKIEEITARVEGELRKKLEALPQGALVLDSKGAVIRGEAGRF